MFTDFDRSTRRIAEILAILSRYGLADWLSGHNSQGDGTESNHVTHVAT